MVYKMKTVKEYARFVYDNIGKAKMNNALNIANEINTHYSFKDFIQALAEVCGECFSDNMKKSILFFDVIKEYSELYESDKLYNKDMILDIFILALCNQARRSEQVRI